MGAGWRAWGEGRVLLGEDARHRSFRIGPWSFVALEGDAQRVWRRGRSARSVRGFSARQSVRLRRMRAGGLPGSRHEGRDVAAFGFFPASRVLACAHAAGELPGVRGSQGRRSLGSHGFGVHAFVRSLRSGAGQGDADANVAERMGEHDTRLWRILDHYVWQGVEQQDLSEVRQIAADETSARRGHDYISLFVDMVRKVVDLADGKDAGNVKEFAGLLESPRRRQRSDKRREHRHGGGVRGRVAGASLQGTIR